MTPTAWADLPNAKHIDRVLADLKKNPDRWSAAMAAEWNAAWSDVWNTARTDARTAAMTDAYNAAWTAAWYAAWGAARDAILALIAYNDCAYLLDEKPEHVQMLGLLGNQAAILLYPACVAMQKEMA